MPGKRPTRPTVSPLLKALRLADRRARRGVLPSAVLLAEWQASVDDAVRLGSPDAAELRLRLAAIGARIFGQAGAGVGAPDGSRSEVEVGRLWQSVFDAPRRGTLGKLAERVAGQLSGVPNQRRIGGQGHLGGSVVLRSPAGLQTTLADEPDAQSRRSQDFILARQSITSGWLEQMGLLGRYGSQVGAYSRLDMPLVLDTDIELDWIEGEPDPFAVPEVIGPARQIAERLISKGARVQVRRGHEVPATQYEPGEARDVEDLTIVGAYGPVSLGSLTVLDQAVLVEEKPGLLHLILAPGAVESARTLPLAEVEPPEAEPVAPDRPGSVVEMDEPQTGVSPRIAEREFQPRSQGRAPSDGEVAPRALIQVTVDWVSGEDPWRHPEVIAETSLSLQERVGASSRVELVRGRELPFERYAPAESRASSDLVLLGPSRPVSLVGVALFEGAVVELQRPGILQVLLAPGSAKQAGERAETRRDYPDLVLAREETAEPEIESVQRNVDVERRVPWLGDVSRREASVVTPTSTDVESVRPGAVVAPQPAYGLLGSRLADEPTLGAAGGLPLIAERESSALPSTATAMRVIDREAELRRAEWARESEALAAPSATRPAPAAPPVITQREPLASSQAPLVESPASSPGAVPPPLDLPLVLEESFVPPEASAPSPEPGLVQRPTVRQQSTAEAEPAPSIAATPDTASQPIAEATSTGISSSPEREPETESPGSVAPASADSVARPSSPVTDTQTPAPFSLPQTGPVPTDAVAREASSPAPSELAQPEQPGSAERDEAVSRSSTPVTGTNEEARSDSVAQETETTEVVAPSENQQLAEVHASSPEPVTGVTQRAVEPPPVARETLAARPPTGESIRITVDWVSGEDPWADPARLEPAREALRTLEDQGIRVELVRGREVPAAQYNPREAQRATDFQMLTTAGPVLLGGVDLLDSAVLVAQRPGSLEVLLAPREFAPAQPGDPYRGAPEMPLAISEEEPQAEGEPVARRETVAPVASPRSVPESETEAVRREATLPPAPSSASEVAALPVSPTSESRMADQSDNTLAQAPELRTTTTGVVSGSEPEPRLDVLRSPGVVAPSATTISPAEATSLPQTPVARASVSEGMDVTVPSPSEPETSWFDWSIARSARRSQVVEITLDWVPGADPWSDPEQLVDARESARMLEDQGIQIVFRRGRELPAASYDVGRSLQPVDFSIVGPSGPVLLETLALLSGANLITQRPGAIEVVLAPLTGPARSSHGAMLPELVFSQETEMAGEAVSEAPGLATETVRRQPASGRAADVRPFEVASEQARETVQFVVDWVAGQDPWSGLAERTAELVQRLDRQGIRLEFVAGRPVSPAEYAEAPAQPAGAFVLPTDRGAISLGDVQWLNQAVLRRQRPGLMHVLVAPDLTQSSSREVERSLPDLVYPFGEADSPDADGGSDTTGARSPQISSSTTSPIPTPSSPIGIPRSDPFAHPVAPAARLSAITGAEASGSPWVRRVTAGTGATPTDQGSGLGSSLEWPAEPVETSRQAQWLDDGRPDIEVATPRGSRPGQRADRSLDLPRPLADSGDFAAEVAQRTGDGLAPGAGSNLALPVLGESESGEVPGRSAAAHTQPLWDNTSSMSVLVYDVTTVDGELDSRRQTVQRFDRSSSMPPIGSALTYVHEGREAEPTREGGADRIGGYIIPSTLIFVSDGELMTAEPRQAARAAADRQPIVAGPTVQRSQTDASGHAGGAAAPAAPNLETLAREVYREIKWRLVAEHERAGTRRLTRGW